MKELWQKYGDIWSMADGPEEALKLAVSPTVIYRDPTTTRSGISEFSKFMGEFQNRVLNGRFQINDAFGHHGRTLALWSMIGGDGLVLLDGVSFALMDEKQRFTEISGFFKA